MRRPAIVQLTWAQGKMLSRNVSFWMASLLIAGLSMTVFGYLFQPDARQFDVAIVNQDGTPASQSFAESFSAVENLEVAYGSLDDEMQRFEDGKFGAVVIIPDGFGEQLTAGQSSIDVRFDSSDPIRASYAQTSVAGVVEAYNRQSGAPVGGVVIDSTGQDTRRVRFIDFLTPGMVGMTIMWTNLVVGQLLITWREQGILRRLGTTPLRPSTLIASQAVAFASVSLVQSAIVLSMGALLFGVKVEGSLVFLALTVSLGIAAMLAIGYTIASFARTTSSAHAVGQLVAFPMMFLGGSYFPMDPPSFLRPIVDAIPLTHLNDALREVVNYGGGAGDIGVHWLALLAWAAAGFIASAMLFRWQ
jgi:ABC-2 type transport system permease protein